MRKLMFAATIAVAAMTAGCDLTAPASPGNVAESTVLDEKIATSVELAYKAARLALETAVDAGLLKGDAATKAAIADDRAFKATQSVQAAYRAGNAATYPELASQAQQAIGEMLAAVRG